MIRYVTRNELDVEKYDHCISSSLQSEIFALSWYLDIAVEKWDVLVLNDYEAVMPIPWRRKYFIKYVFPPFWILQLGIFSKNQNVSEEELVSTLKKKFLFVELRMNSGNSINPISKKSKVNQYQTLLLDRDWNELQRSYKSDRKKDLKRAEKHGLEEKWNDKPEALIHLFRENVGKRTPNILDKDYQVLDTLIKTSIDRGVGEVLSVYENDQLVASAFFLQHKNTVTILLSSTDFSNRKNGANTFLIDRAIKKYAVQFSVFNFGGSSIPSIAKFFSSFGAKTHNYLFLKLSI